jgi:uncharacterized integral membrane protein
MQLAFIASLVIAIISVLFALQNNVPVTIMFLFWRFDSSLALVLLGALALGAIAIALLTTPATVRRQWLISRQKKHIDDQEKALEKLSARIVELETISGQKASEYPMSPPSKLEGSF